MEGRIGIEEGDVEQKTIRDNQNLLNGQHTTRWSSVIRKRVATNNQFFCIKIEFRF